MRFGRSSNLQEEFIYRAVRTPPGCDSWPVTTYLASEKHQQVGIYDEQLGERRPPASERGRDAGGGNLQNWGAGD